MAPPLELNYSYLKVFGTFRRKFGFVFSKTAEKIVADQDPYMFYWERGGAFYRQTFLTVRITPSQTQETFSACPIHRVLSPGTQSWNTGLVTFPSSMPNEYKEELGTEDIRNHVAAQWLRTQALQENEWNWNHDAKWKKASSKKKTAHLDSHNEPGFKIVCAWLARVFNLKTWVGSPRSM